MKKEEVVAVCRRFRERLMRGEFNQSQPVSDEIRRQFDAAKKQAAERLSGFQSYAERMSSDQIEVALTADEPAVLAGKSDA